MTALSYRTGSGPSAPEPEGPDGFFDIVPRFIRKLDGYRPHYAAVIQAIIELSGKERRSCPARRETIAGISGVSIGTASRVISWGRSVGVFHEKKGDRDAPARRRLLLLWRRSGNGVRRITPEEALAEEPDDSDPSSHKRSCAPEARASESNGAGLPHVEDRPRESRSSDREIERLDPGPISTPTITIPEPEPPAPSEAREPVALVASLGAALCSARAPESRPAPSRAAPPPSPDPDRPAPQPPPRRRSRMDPDELLRMTERLAAEGDPAALAELQRRGCAPPAPPPPDAPVPELVRALASGDPGVRDPTIPLAVNAIMAETGDSGELSYRTWLKVCGEVASRARPPESIIEPLENTFRRIAAGERIPNVPGYVMRGVKRWKPPDRVRASPVAVS